MSAFLFAILLIMINGPIYPQSIGRQSNIEWKPVENANGYIIEIQDENKKVVLKKRIKQSNIQVKLNPGKFQFRVGVINKFNKIGIWSEWGDLDIKKPTLPVFKSLHPSIIKPENKNPKMVLKGENLFQFTEIQLKTSRDKKEIPILKKEFIDSKTIEFTLDTSKALPGEYSLSLVNPGDKVFRKENIISIIAPRETHLQKIGGNLFSIGLSPQWFIFGKQQLSSLLKINRAFSFDLLLDRYALHSITPGIRFGYFSFTGTKEYSLSLSGYKMDGFLSYSYSIKPGLQIISTLGGGLSSIALKTSIYSENEQAENFREGTYFIGLDLKYKFYNFLSILAGVEFFNLQDNYGKISFFIPRVGITAAF